MRVKGWDVKMHVNNIKWMVNKNPTQIIIRDRTLRCLKTLISQGH